MDNELNNEPRQGYVCANPACSHLVYQIKRHNNHIFCPRCGNDLMLENKRKIQRQKEHTHELEKLRQEKYWEECIFQHQAEVYQEEYQKKHDLNYSHEPAYRPYFKT